MPFPYQNINWSNIPKTEHVGSPEGSGGTSFWQTIQQDGLRIRIVEYTPGYLADHWCKKGHFVHCLEGAFVSELENGESFTLSAGMSYLVSDEMSSHRSATEMGAKLLIIDGDFLK